MTSQPEETSTGRRQVALALVAFIATLVLLVGLSRIVGQAAVTASPTPSPAGPTATPSRASASPSAASSASPSASAASSPSPSASGPDTTAPPAPSASAAAEAVIVGAGDIGDCDTTDDTATGKLLDGIEGTVFTAGDNAYPSGRAKDFQDCYDPVWGRVRDRTRPAPGNHDWLTKDLKGYLDYFGTAAAPGRRSLVLVRPRGMARRGPRFDVRPDRRLRQGLGPGQLAGRGPRCVEGDVHARDLARAAVQLGRAWELQGRCPLLGALYAAGADVVVNGHDHDYERFAPQDPDGNEDRDRGIREFVVGTGGAELRPFKDARPNSELRAAVTHGVLKLELHPRSYDWTFIPTGGDFADSGSGPCH